MPNLDADVVLVGKDGEIPNANAESTDDLAPEALSGGSGGSGAAPGLAKVWENMDRRWNFVF